MRDGDITDALHSAEVIIQDFKTKQKLTGDSWQVYHGDTNTPNEYDIFYTGLTADSSFRKMWKVTYQINSVKSTNAFAIFMDKIGGPNESSRTDVHQLTPGFTIVTTTEADDPLVEYVYVQVEQLNYTPTANSYFGIKFRAVSPYKGRVIYEEIYNI
jgi:hypothetical protein